MPLSRCLTLSSIVWFFYGCFSHDYSIVMASVLGCLLSVAQIILYRKWNGSGDDERERVAIASKTRENNKDTLDDEVLQVIDIAVRKVKVRKSDNSNEEEENATRVELEATETVELQNIAVTGNDSVMDSEIHSVVEPEIVEVLDKPKYAMLDRAPSKLS
ncbi:uncharacterized protein LOC109796501 [Cajanus cajan]|nr:uncharacterized protein LOC109796501 [Cajanus cajan]